MPKAKTLKQKVLASYSECLADQAKNLALKTFCLAHKPKGLAGKVKSRKDIAGKLARQAQSLAGMPKIGADPALPPADDTRGRTFDNDNACRQALQSKPAPDKYCAGR